MSEKTEGQAKASPAKRGDAAWREMRDGIAARNDQARKDGRKQRETEERDREDRRRSADGVRRAALLKKQGKR